MSGKQKIYFLINRICDIRAISPSSQPLIVDPMNDLNDKYRDVELLQLFTKLEKDEQILKVLKVPSRTKSIDAIENLDPYPHADDGCYHIKLDSRFEYFFLRMQNEPEYQMFTGKKLPVQIKQKLSRKSLKKIWDILQEIEDKRGITSIQDDISIPQVHMSKVKNEREANNASDERITILKKLENEENAIKNVRFPDNFHGSVYLKIGDMYFNVYKQYEDEYVKMSKEYQEQGKATGDLSLLHPDVFNKCQSLFQKAEYPEAVEKSFKVVRDKLRTLTTHETGSEAFGKGNLHIKGAAAQNVDDDFNAGVKFLTMAIDRFRNEKSHTSDAKIDDPQRAYEYLTLSSLAMNLLDQAELLTSPKG